MTLLFQKDMCSDWEVVWGRVCEVDRAGRASVRDKRSLTQGIGIFGKIAEERLLSP